MAVSVVTGATGGIGIWIARGLAEAGHHVVLVGRNQKRIQTAQQWIIDNVPPASTEVAVADLSLLAATRELGKSLRLRHPKIDVLVNNAGIFDMTRAITSEHHERVLATNLLSPVVLSESDPLTPSRGDAGTPEQIVVAPKLQELRSVGRRNSAVGDAGSDLLKRCKFGVCTRSDI
jgi:NAD(P)-dependent dehydrogenase (short-subunit alcohol dehydrogenase family)